MILVAISNIIQRKGLEALIRESDAPAKVFGVSTHRDFHKFISNHKPSIIYLHSDFNPDIKPHNLPESEVRIIKVIEEKPDIFVNNESTFDIIYLNDKEPQLVKNIKRNIALSEKQERHDGEERNLSEREQDVIREIALGRTNKEIADNLFISAHTVITHRKNITRKLGIKTVSGLTVYAILNKIIQMEEI